MFHVQVLLKRMPGTAAKCAELQQDLVRVLPMWACSGHVGWVHLGAGGFSQSQECGISSSVDMRCDANSRDTPQPPTAATNVLPPNGNSQPFVDFTALEKWEDVQKVIRELDAEIKPSQVGAAFGCLKKIDAKGTKVPREFLTDLVATLIGLGKDLDARVVADVLHACGKMKYSNRTVVDHMADLVVNLNSPAIDSFDARAIATLVNALGSLRHVIGPEVLEKGKIGKLKQQAIARLSHHDIPVWNSRNAVQVMYGLSLLKINDRALCRRILAAFSDPGVLKGTSERELSSLAYSMAVLQVDHPDLLAQIVAEVCKEERREGMRKIGVASIIHSICKLGFHDLSALGKLVDFVLEKKEESRLSPLDLAQIVHALSTRGVSGHSMLEKLGHECSQVKFLRECTDHELCTIVHGFSKLKHMPPYLAQSLSKEVGKKKRYSKLTDQGLTNVLYGFSRLNVGDDDFKAKLIKEAARRTRLANATPQGLSNILLSIRQWKYEGEEYSAVVKEISKQSRLDSFDSHTLSSVIYSLSQLNYNNVQVLQSIVSECVKPEKIVTFKAQGIANLIVALSNMGISDALVWHILSTEATKPSRLTAFTEQGLVQILYALQHVRINNDELFRAIGKEILVPERLSSYSAESLAGAFVSLATADFSWKSMDSHSLANVLKEISKPTRLRSFSERGLCSILKAMRLLSLKADRVLSAVVDEVLSDRILPKMHELGLCSVLVSFSKMGIKDPEKYAAVCARIVDEKIVKHLRPRELTSIFDSLFWADCSLPECMEKTFPLISTGQFVHNCTENELVLMFRAFRGLGISDSTITGPYINEILKPERFSRLSGKQIVTVLEGCLDMAINTVRPIHEMLEQNLHIFDQTGAHHLVQITIRLCQLGREFDDITKKVVQKLTAPEKLKRVIDSDLKDVVEQLEVVELPFTTDLVAERERRKEEKQNSTVVDNNQGSRQSSDVVIASNSGSILNVA